MTKDDYLEVAKRTIRMEAQAIELLEHRIGQDFLLACKLIINCPGRVVVTGMGKSGHIGRKIAATLASTGTPAFFVHPGEASHGDIGMITDKDVVLAFQFHPESILTTFGTTLLAQSIKHLLTLAPSLNNTLKTELKTELKTKVTGE